MSPTVAFVISQKHWFKPPPVTVHTFFPRTTSQPSIGNGTDATCVGGGHATANAVFEPAHLQGMPLICTSRANPPHNYRDHRRICWPKKNHHRAVDSDPVGGSAGNTDLAKDVYLSTDNCLPRIIKPRKRRKKDRQPLATVPIASANLANSSCYVTATCPTAANEFCWPLSFPGSTMRDVRTTPARGSGYTLHKIECISPSDLHSDEFKEGGCSQHTTVGSLPHVDRPDVGVAESSATPAACGFCNCKYCDPESDVWDIHQRCFSPTLMPPHTPQKGASTSISSYGCSNTINLRGNSSEPTSSTPFTTPIITRVHSLSSSCDAAGQNLLVSSQIVTSHNGHRDIEVKFYSTADSSQV